MADDRRTRGLADMIATIISPILIMAMVGSLVYFLIEVLYGGEFSSRLRWTFGFFVFGAVLVARIGIEMGNAKATLYALGLGAGAFLAMVRFVEYPRGGFLEQFGWLINIGLLVLVWWCAKKLTWDCTHIDPDRDASDHSLLEAAGLDSLKRPEEWRDDEEPEEEEKGKKKKRKRPMGLAGWWQRYCDYSEAQKKKPHTPGVWVVYFSLAALPIFGLGQALIPSDTAEGLDSRRYTFWLMAMYVGAGMGLLMTTSFLGLRRYLQNRKLKIPMKMAATWLGVGTGLILLFLIVGALLPRPSSEYSMLDFTPIGSKKRDASNYAMKQDGKGKGEGNGGEERDQKSDSKNSTEGKSDEAGKGKGQDDSKKGSGQDKGKGGESGNNKKAGNQPNKNSGDQGKKGESSDEKKNDAEKKDGSDEKKSESGSGRDKASESKSKSSSSKSSSSSVKNALTNLHMGRVGSVLKWILFAVLALIVAFYIFRHGLKFLANFTQWAKQLLDFINNFWSRLFGAGTAKEARAEMEEEPEESIPRPRPFADFSNPFDTGTASGQSPAELVEYSFAALEAWAYEHEQGRQEDETPLEFANRVARGSSDLQQDAPRLANWYARLAYARGALPEASREHVREFWRQLEIANEEMLMQQKETVEG
ncbi:MAG TPA: DUF4129 domain-containing protein [Gemmataceae bacterium]|nr:DUF4129 domain-containing protein [Gemmataceae bacterium]